MNRPVWFSKITIERTLGFPNGGFIIDNLAQGINVIYGPNGSGKTTLARTIKRLLGQSPESQTKEFISGNLHIDDKNYFFSCESGQFEFLVEGRKTTIPFTEVTWAGSK